MKALGIDVGGSGIKAAPVDLKTGKRLAKRRRIATPQPSTPQAVYSVVAELVGHFGWKGPVGLALPAIIRSGVAFTAANIDDSWIGTDARSDLSERLGLPVTVLNDADAAGLAENMLGTAQDLDGVVLLLTLGTGIGSALFTDGVLVPNTELGHLEFKGNDAEAYAAARVVAAGLPEREWARRLNEFLQHVERVLPPDHFILGGGISKNFDQYSDLLHTRASIRPARFRNRAGIIGAALSTRGTT
ncbi:MAG: ROK family protein [Acidimicrobiia bacterium]|nr:ROK family protein [Acidimicrobiia bacterium]MDX2468064.1 ROK family protein [Acidimicrobiia bacterium]